MASKALFTAWVMRCRPLQQEAVAWFDGGLPRIGGTRLHCLRAVSTWTSCMAHVLVPAGPHLSAPLSTKKPQACAPAPYLSARLVSGSVFALTNCGHPHLSAMRW